MNKSIKEPQDKFRPELQTYSGVAILFVVLIHAFIYYWSWGLGLTTVSKQFYGMGIANKVILAILQLPVPIFVFISGYKYQLNKGKYLNFKDLFLKRINKVLRPFMLYSVLLILYANGFKLVKFLISYDTKHFVTVIFKIFISFLNIFIGYNFAYQLWYVPMYLLIVLTYPWIYRVTSQRHRVIIFSLFAIISVYLLVAHPGQRIHPLDFVYYFYLYELGGIFARYVDKLRNSKLIILAVIPIYLVLILVSSLTRSYEIESILIQLSIPLGVISFLYLSLFQLNNRALQILGEYSFYIFMFHEPLVMNKLAYVLLKQGLLKSVISVPILCLFTILISISIYKIISASFLKEAFFGNQKQLLKEDILVR